MRELVLRIPRLAVEDVLDRLLPIVPGGVREGRAGGHVELRMRGAGLPAREEIERAVGRWPHTLAEREVPDDWRRRRLHDYRPDVIGDRLVVRPEWAPRSERAPRAEGTPRADRGPIEIVLAEGAAFGSGTHPTTRTCLELLLELPARGSFADLGCGTGVLALAAARLGFSPVTAVDLDPGSVEAVRGNAVLNGVEVAARVADLMTEPPPVAGTLAANVPAAVHGGIAERLTELPRTLLLSGFGSAEADDVVAQYGRRGMHERRRLDRHGWSIVVAGSN